MSWRLEDEDEDWQEYAEEEEPPPDRGGALIGMKKYAIVGLIVVLVAFVGVRVLAPLLRALFGS